MKELYTQLYSEMHVEIDRHMHLPHPEKVKVEKCYLVTRNYWKKLKEAIRLKKFNDQHEEIRFFINDKPRFACHIEYFHLIKEALSNLPEKKDAAISFWVNEKRRLNIFRRKHASFVSFYENREHDSDITYFLTGNNELKFSSDLGHDEVDIDWCTSHDRLVRNYLAYKKYDEYCTKKIFELIFP